MLQGACWPLCGLELWPELGLLLLLLLVAGPDLAMH